MPTSIIFDPAGDGANLIYGTDFGVSAVHDPAVNYDAVYYGLGGSDIIYDTDANGWIWARPGDTSAVFFYGQGGNDVLVGFDGNDWLDGGNGNDILIGNNGNDALTGGLDNDQLWGGFGSDQLNGGPGVDIVVGGGGGSDYLAGGSDLDQDILIGTFGNFDEYSLDRTDIAWNFDVGTDQVKLSGGTSARFSYDTEYGYRSDLGLTGTSITARNPSGSFSNFAFLAGTQVNDLSELKPVFV